MKMNTGTHTPWHGMLAAGCLMTLCGAGLFTAGCNPNTVTYLSSTIINPEPGIDLTSRVNTPMDILWVVDNSSSMCQEQKVLRDNFSQFVDVLSRSNLNFHMALTTTHAPEGASVIEPIAMEAHLQSTPQPIPGNASECLRGDGEGTEFAPFRESLEVAKTCLADPSKAQNYVWTDPQIACALEAPMAQQASGCVASTQLQDINQDGRYDSFDLFPATADYRPIHKVLKASDYRNADGSLDTARLTLDFSCMSTVGTRGDGYEKGLRAAVKAVSPEMTGGPLGGISANTNAPNHGFIRENSGFALIFVTDENDCSHDSSIMEPGNICGANICEYMNSPEAIASGQSALISPEQFAEDLRKNLKATKNLPEAQALNEETLLVASINGTSRRYDAPFPSCEESRPELQPVCESALGKAYSGDRYERFMRQFRNFYPNSILQGDDRPPEEIRTDFSRYEPLGWMCTDTFAPALVAIADSIGSPPPPCISDSIYACQTDADCPEKAYSGVAGTCRDYPGGEEGQKYCDSGIAVVLERDPQVEALNDDINDIDYCLPRSINQIGMSDNASCVIDPARYMLAGCDSGRGVQFGWVEDEQVVANKLSGYKLEAVFSLEP